MIQTNNTNLLNYYCIIGIENNLQFMNSVWNWWKGGSKNYNQSHVHGEITKFCCSDACKYDREVCDRPDCAQKHKGHTLMDYRAFKEAYANALEQIKNRKKVEDTIREYHQKLVLAFQQILQVETNKLIGEIDKKIYNKNFIQMYKRDLSGKSFYSYLPQFFLQYGSQINTQIQKIIREKQNKIVDQLRQFISSNRILLQQYLSLTVYSIKDDPSQNKIDRIRSIIPFPCHLTRIFQASKHRFQASKLHKIGIRGPIILVAQSYKGKIFGGFTPKMFPKDEYYQQDNRCRSFLFSLDHRVILPLRQEYKKFSIKGGNNLWFGRGDLVIADECNKGNISWAQIGRAYQVPPGIHGNVDEWLGGALYFRIVQYQIYEVESSSFTAK